MREDANHCCHVNRSAILRILTNTRQFHNCVFYSTEIGSVFGDLEDCHFNALYNEYI